MNYFLAFPHSWGGPALAQGGLNTQGVVTWVATYIVPLLVAVTAVSILAKSGNKTSDAMQKVTVTMIGVGLLAAGASFFAFGEHIVAVFFNAGNGLTGGSPR